MESSVILATKQHAGIFKLSVITSNLLQRVNMLMDTKGRCCHLPEASFPSEVKETHGSNGGVGQGSHRTFAIRREKKNYHLVPQ